MKLLLIHSDFIEYEVKGKAIKNPEETKIKADKLEEALTAFTAVEKVDEKSPKQSVKQTVEEITKTAEQLKVQKKLKKSLLKLNLNLSNIILMLNVHHLAGIKLLKLVAKVIPCLNFLVKLLQVKKRKQKMNH